MGVLQGAQDLTRVFLNSAAMGIPEWAGRTFGGQADAEQAQRNAAELAAARQRTGYAGDAANVAGFFTPGLGAAKALSGLKYLPTLGRGVAEVTRGAVKAVPAAERAVARAVVPGYAAREAALTRLSTPYMANTAQHFAVEMPTLSGTVGRAVAAHPVKTALSAAALGGGTAVSHNMRTYDQQHLPQLSVGPAAQPQAKSAPKPVDAPRNTSNADQLADELFNAARESRGAPTYENMLNQIAAAQGGNISIAQMGALAEIAQRTATKPVKPPRPQDVMMDEAHQIAMGQYAARQRAGVPDDKNQEQTYNELKELLKIAPQYYPQFDEGDGG